jgi:hypothetical protein
MILGTGRHVPRRAFARRSVGQSAVLGPGRASPGFLTCGTHETLQDNAERFAALARRAGLRVEEGMRHFYQCMVGRAPEAGASTVEAGKWLNEQLDAERQHMEKGLPIVPDLAPFAEAPLDHGLCVFNTVRRDGSVQSSVVDAG